MRHLSAFVILAASAVPAFAQDFIHYKFDSTCGSEVINYATGPQALASNGSLQSTSTASPYVPGMFGQALAAGGPVTPTFYNKVLTGWDPGTQPVTGDLTMAWFMRQGPTVGTSANYLMGAPSGGFRLFTNGVAGRGLYQRLILAGGGNGTNSSIANDFYLPASTVDIQTLAATAWVHVAMVVDATAQTADWYVNGTSVLTLQGVPGAQINTAGPFQLGYYSNACQYDLDEFLMSFRAYSPAEILALSLSQQAGDGDYNSGIPSQCGSLGLASSGGRPSVGNVLYALDINSNINGFFSLQFGLQRCSLHGAVPLPLDLGLLAPSAAGCWLLTDMFANVNGISSGSPVSVPFPIIPLPNLNGVTIYSQALMVDFATNGFTVSNGFSFSLGF